MRVSKRWRFGRRARGTNYSHLHPSAVSVVIHYRPNNNNNNNNMMYYPSSDLSGCIDKPRDFFSVLFLRLRRFVAVREMSKLRRVYIHYTTCPTGFVGFENVLAFHMNFTRSVFPSASNSPERVISFLRSEPTRIFLFYASSYAKRKVYLEKGFW